MAEVMLKVVPLGLERVVVLVLDLPSRTGEEDQILDVLSGDAVGGKPGIEEDRFCLPGLGHGELDPASPKGVLLSREGDVVHEAVGEGQPFLLPHPLGPMLHDGGGGALEIFVEGLVARLLADEEEVGSPLLNQTTEGLTGIEVVSHDGDSPPVEITVEPPLDPAAGGFDLGVLLLLAVFPNDELRRQGDDPGLSRTDEDGSHRRMGVSHLV